MTERLIAFPVLDLAAAMRSLHDGLSPALRHALRASGLLFPPTRDRRTVQAFVFRLELREYLLAQREHERLHAFACPHCGSDREVPGLRVWRCASCGLDAIGWGLRRTPGRGFDRPWRA